MKVNREHGVVALALLAIIATNCGESEYGTGTVIGQSQYWVPGGNMAQAESLHRGDEISLVTLVFARVESTGIEVVDEITQRDIGFQAVESDDFLAVTLQLNSNVRSEPHLKLLGADGKTFRARIHPTHSLETYRDLELERPGAGLEVPQHSLRDYGSMDVLLREDESVTVPYQDMVTLWNGSRFVLAARVRIANPGETGRFFLRANPGGCQSWVAQGGQLQAVESFPIRNRENMGLMASPSVCSPLELHLVRQEGGE